MISIIIPTYNSEKYIKDCLLSIINNSYQNFEIIIIDDGSTDKTIPKAQTINDKRIHIVKQNRKGPGSARNKGISLAKGDYIFFIDSDDIINNNTLELLINNIKDNDILIGNYQIIYDSGQTEYFVTPDDCNFNTFFESVTIWNRLYKKEFITNNNICFEPIYQGEDRLFLAELYLKNPKVKILNHFIYNWLRHDKDENNTLTHIKDHTNFDGQVSCMINFKNKLEKNLNKEETSKLIEHLRYSCYYLLDILKNTDSKTCDINKFNQFIESLNFFEDKELYKKIFNQDIEV